MGFAFIYKIFKKMGWQLRLIAALVLVILAVVAYFTIKGWWYQSEIKREQEARSQESQMRIDEAKENANIAGNVANQSLENANQARNANINSFNGNFSDARRRYCGEFPNDCK